MRERERRGGRGKEERGLKQQGRGGRERGREEAIPGATRWARRTPFKRAWTEYLVKLWQQGGEAGGGGGLGEEEEEDGEEGEEGEKHGWVGKPMGKKRKNKKKTVRPVPIRPSCLPSLPPPSLPPSLPTARWPLGSRCLTGGSRVARAYPPPYTRP